MLGGLGEALRSHRYALALESAAARENADTLFNTAQVLTTLAEEMGKSDGRDGEGDVGEMMSCLEEALELQGRCLRIQEMSLEEREREKRFMLAEESDTQSDVPAEAQKSKETSLDAAEDQWFAVIEPVTTSTLIDTALAQLATLTTLCSILSSTASPPSSPSLLWIEEFSYNSLNTKISTYAATADAERLQEIALTKATFLSAFLEASFHQGAIDVETYKNERDNAFKTAELRLEGFPEGLIANAESLMSFCSAIADDVNASGDRHGQIRWQALSAAIANLTMASRVPSVDGESVVKTHLLRAEASLMQWTLSRTPMELKMAVENQGQLLRNAQVFYGNVGKLSGDEEEKGRAVRRGMVVRGLQGNVEVVDGEVRREMEEMREEGLLGD